MKEQRTTILQSDNLEFKWSDHNSRFEIIEVFSCDNEECCGKDGKESCIVIAYWQKNNEGYYLQFVGDRPFHSAIDREDFWRLAKFGQHYLNALFEYNER